MLVAHQVLKAEQTNLIFKTSRRCNFIQRDHVIADGDLTGTDTQLDRCPVDIGLLESGDSCFECIGKLHDLDTHF